MSSSSNTSASVLPGPWGPGTNLVSLGTGRLGCGRPRPPGPDRAPSGRPRPPGRGRRGLVDLDGVCVWGWSRVSPVAWVVMGAAGGVLATYAALGVVFVAVAALAAVRAWPPERAVLVAAAARSPPSSRPGERATRCSGSPPGRRQRRWVGWRWVLPDGWPRNGPHKRPWSRSAKPGLTPRKPGPSCWRAAIIWPESSTTSWPTPFRLYRSSSRPSTPSSRMCLKRLPRSATSWMGSGGDPGGPPTRPGAPSGPAGGPAPARGPADQVGGRPSRRTRLGRRSPPALPRGLAGVVPGGSGGAHQRGQTRAPQLWRSSTWPLGTATSVSRRAMAPAASANGSDAPGRRRRWLRPPGHPRRVPLVGGKVEEGPAGTGCRFQRRSRGRARAVDDQRVVREGLATIVGNLPGVEVVGLAADGAEAEAAAGRRPTTTRTDGPANARDRRSSGHHRHPSPVPGHSGCGAHDVRRRFLIVEGWPPGPLAI